MSQQPVRLIAQILYGAACQQPPQMEERARAGAYDAIAQSPIFPSLRNSSAHAGVRRATVNNWDPATDAQTAGFIRYSRGKRR